MDRFISIVLTLASGFIPSLHLPLDYSDAFLLLHLSSKTASFYALQLDIEQLSGRNYSTDLVYLCYVTR